MFFQTRLPGLMFKYRKDYKSLKNFQEIRINVPPVLTTMKPLGKARSFDQKCPWPIGAVYAEDKLYHFNQTHVVTI